MIVQNEKGGIRIALEEQQQKKILHCYGHGGCGFTTLFGSIEKALRLFDSLNLDKAQPIHVIGAGCMGLVLAIELYRRGYHALTISAKELYDLPSWRAGGFVDPGTGLEDDTEGLARLELGLASFAVMQTIYQNQHPYLSKDIVELLPVYAPENMLIEVEVLEQLGIMPPAEPVTLDFGNGVIHPQYLKHYTYFLHISALMKQLWQQIKEFGISVLQEEIQSFDDCSENVICNCAGLGAAALTNDMVYPVRGHFFMITDPQEAPRDYMLFAKVEQEDKREMIYFFPKNCFISSDNTEGISCAGMIGGTAIKGVEKLSEEEQQELNEYEWKKLFARIQQFFGDHLR